MSRDRPKLEMPPVTTTRDGSVRRVGVELEMSGLTVDELAALVARELGLEVESRGRYERALVGDPAGTWQVELDFHYLKALGREELSDETLADGLRGTAEEALKRLAEPIVPIELVTPPLPIDRLAEVEALIVALRDAGAKGTSDRITNAFGLQFNPEVPAGDAGTLTAYIKAFACLQDWLFARAAVNVSRRATTFADPYPAAYVRRVIGHGYAPDLGALIDDYLRHNPTRNRALDLLPLFMELDAPRVRAVVDDVLVRARPTFHYRLPNCDIHLRGWGIWLAWNDWVQVERLAADCERLAACCAAYTTYLRNPLKRWLGDWARVVGERWLAR